MRTWSADELAAFLTFNAQDPHLPLYHVAAATGMRRGELLGLRWARPSGEPPSDGADLQFWTGTAK